MLLTTLDVAHTQLGVAEATGNNDGIPASRYNRGDALPWCAAFILWCNAQSDDPKLARSTAEFYRMRAVTGFEEECRRCGTWRPADSRISPGANEVVFFQGRGQSDKGGGRHVGLVEGFDARESVLSTVEGNWGNCVQRVRHDLRIPRVAARITGYAQIR